MSGRGRVVVAVWVFSIALLIVGTALYVVNEAQTDGTYSPQMLLVPGFSTIGAVVALRTSNRIGWLFLVLGAVAAVTLLAGQLDVRAQIAGWDQGLIRPLAAWLSNWTWPLNYLLLGTAMVLFPDGSLPSRRWRWVVRVMVASWAILIAATALQSEQLALGPSGAVANPFAVPIVDAVLDVIGGTLTAVAVASFVAAALAPVTRWRAGHGSVRQQMKWVAYALVAATALMGIGAVATAASLETFAAVAVGSSGVLITMGVPVAVGVAVLRYRLYDIDLIIKRTLVYGVLTAILAATYFGLVVALQRVLAPVTEESDVAVAASTLAVAALFGPARRRVQEFIDRRFYRSRYDAQKTLESFSTRMRDEVELDRLSDELLAVVSSAMHPRHASLWLARQSAK